MTTFQRVQRELTAEEVTRLHELRASGKRLKELAYEFGISHQTVSRYLRGLAAPPAVDASCVRARQV
jgi:transcriptional regulator with XRE-family HTH domain